MPMRAPTHSEQRGRQASDAAYARKDKWQTERHIYTTRRWQRLRKRVLHVQPWCADPYGWHAEDQHPVLAVQVDHIVPLKTDMGLAYTRSNLQGLCTRCHARKTRDGG